METYERHVLRSRRETEAGGPSSSRGQVVFAFRKCHAIQLLSHPLNLLPVPASRGDRKVFQGVSRIGFFFLLRSGQLKTGQNFVAFKWSSSISVWRVLISESSCSDDSQLIISANRDKS